MPVGVLKNHVRLPGVDAWRGVGVAEHVPGEAEEALVGLVGATEANYPLQPYLHTQLEGAGTAANVSASVQ